MPSLMWAGNIEEICKLIIINLTYLGPKIQDSLE